MAERRKELRRAIETVDLMVEEAYNLTKVLYHFHKFHVELARLFLVPPFARLERKGQS